MNKTIIILSALFLSHLISCKEDTTSNRKNITVKKTDKTFDINNLKIFPEISIDKILRYYKTSGVQEKSPSKKYYNPSDSGLFVFYTLFEESNKDEHSHTIEMGTLTTHTYFKKYYGWAAEDKDQTFIELSIKNGSLRVGNNLYIGADIKALEKEFGLPIISKENLSFYLGNNMICQVKHSNNKIDSFIIGRYNVSSTSDYNVENIINEIETLFM